MWRDKGGIQALKDAYDSDSKVLGARRNYITSGNIDDPETEKSLRTKVVRNEKEFGVCFICGESPCTHPTGTGFGCPHQCRLPTLKKFLDSKVKGSRQNFGRPPVGGAEAETEPEPRPLISSSDQWRSAVRLCCLAYPCYITKRPAAGYVAPVYSVGF